MKIEEAIVDDQVPRIGPSCLRLIMTERSPSADGGAEVEYGWNE